MTVARGIVRPGSRTRPAGIVAHSMPSIANSAVVDALTTLPNVAGVVGRCSV